MDILTFFLTFYLNHLSPLQGYFLHQTIINDIEKQLIEYPVPTLLITSIGVNLPRITNSPFSCATSVDVPNGVINIHSLSFIKQLLIK